MTSPTQRSLAHLRKAGLICAIVEHFNVHCGIRQDLYGWIDILALDPVTGELTAVQTTSGPNVAARIDKIRAWPHLQAWLLRHRAVVHGWSKKGPRGKRKLWALREVDLSYPDLVEVDAA